MPESLHEVIVKHTESIDDHEGRLTTVEEKIEAQDRKIENLEHNWIKLENLILSEGKDTRTAVMSTNVLLQDTVNGLMGYNTSKNQFKHNYRMAQIESIVKIIGVLAGSGGILWFLFGQ